MPADLDQSLEKARNAKAETLKIFNRLAGSAAVGITRIGDQYGLKVNLAEPLAESVSPPSSVNGVPVCIEVTGQITKRLPAEPS
jgi:hypothetical protein